MPGSDALLLEVVAVVLGSEERMLGKVLQPQVWEELDSSACPYLLFVVEMTGLTAHWRKLMLS
jgi:hypothetical protein